MEGRLSSQYFSAVLMAAPYAARDVEITGHRRSRLEAIHGDYRRRNARLRCRDGAGPRERGGHSGSRRVSDIAAGRTRSNRMPPTPRISLQRRRSPADGSGCRALAAARRRATSASSARWSRWAPRVAMTDDATEVIGPAEWQLARDRDRHERDLRHGPDAGGDCARSPTVQPRSGASPTTGTRRPTGSPTWPRNCAGSGRRSSSSRTV